MSEFKVVEVGPIWSNNDFNGRKASFADTQPGWELSGQWWTTVPGKMSVVQYRKVTPPPPAKIEIKVHITVPTQIHIEVPVVCEFGVIQQIDSEGEFEMNEPTELFVTQEQLAIDGNETWGDGFHIPAHGWYAMEGQAKNEVVFEDLQIHTDGSIAGQGFDTVGAFYIYGQGQFGGQMFFNFVKQYYGQHYVQYQGSVSRGVMTGTWEIPGNCNGTFNIVPGYQKWKGGFWQFGTRNQMTLNSLYIGAGGVKGAGSDDVGAFRIRGRANGNDVCFAKEYIGAHTVFYMGKLNGKHVQGRWWIPNNCDGTFSLQRMA